MADIIDFTKINKGKASSSGLDLDEYKDYLNFSTKMMKDMVDMMDENTSQILSTLPGTALNGMHFHLDMDRFMEASPDSFLTEEGCEVLYLSDEEEGETPQYQYVLRLSFSLDEETEEVTTTLRSVYRQDLLDHTIVRMDGETGEWVHSARMDRVIQLAYGTTEEARYLEALADHTGVDLEVMNEDRVLPMLSRDAKLIHLGAKVRRLAWYDFPDSGADGDQAVLIPHDPCRCGCAVMMDGDEYVLCQYITGEDMLDAADEEGDFFGYNFTRTPFEWLSCEGTFLLAQEVARTKREKDMVRIIWQMWDHYSGDDIMFCIPLSANVYVESERPFRRLTLRSRYGRRTPDQLSEEEQVRYKQVRSVFQRSRLIREPPSEP